MKKLLMLALVLTSAAMTASLFTVSAQGGITAFATNTPLPDLPSAATPTAAAPSEGPRIFDAPECAYVEGQPTSQACLDLMARYPKPDVTPIRVDSYTMETYSFWRVGPDPVNTYDGPNGSVIGQIPQGFNFVNVVNSVDGWIQSENGQWISTADASYRRPSYFTGVLLPEGWNQPFGWILDTTGIWASTVPGGPPTAESGLVPLHYERYNIFAEVVAEDGWTYYMVGPNQWIKQIYMSVIKPTPRPEGVTGRWVAVDLFEQSLVAYEGDTPVFATLISTGLPGSDTNEGVFEVWARLARDTMSGATGAPNAYALQSVPWVQYFDGSISLHGTYWHDFFGYRRSRGCVNLTISDARWVYEFFERAPENAAGSRGYVYVHSTGEYRRP